MHKFITLLIVLLVILGAGVYYQDEVTNLYEENINFSFCDNPIGYNIVQIDTAFNVTKEEVLKNTKEAAQIWNDAYGSTLFTYDEESSLDLSLVFDERQRAANRITVQEERVQIEKIQLGVEVGDYEKKYEAINGAISELNKQIQFWNEEGGAPPKIYEELSKKQQELNSSIDELNKLANNLNSASDTVNSKIDLLNDNISAFNDLLDTLPEEGIYIPQENKIEIYFYDSNERFVHTVAHELGHALGLTHVAKENAIMHPTTSENISPSEEDLQELSRFCADQNKLEFFKTNFELSLQNFRLKLMQMDVIKTIQGVRLGF